MPSEEKTKEIADRIALVVKIGLSDPRKCYNDVITDVHKAVLQEISAFDGSSPSSVSFLQYASYGNPDMY